MLMEIDIPHKLALLLKPRPPDHSAAHMSLPVRDQEPTASISNIQEQSSSGAGGSILIPHIRGENGRRMPQTMRVDAL